MSLILDWPQGLQASGAGFWRQDRVSITRGRPFLNASGVYEQRSFIEDRGSFWRASLQVDSAPSREDDRFGRLQSFLMQLRGGVNLARVHDPRYCRPMGSARTLDDWGRITGKARYETGAKLGPTSEWVASGGVVFAEAAEAGATDLRLRGGFPGDQAICAFDRVTIGAHVYIVAEAERVGEFSAFALSIFDGLASVAEAGSPVALGGRFSRAMQIVNAAEAANNFSRAGGSASQTLEFRDPV